MTAFSQKKLLLFDIDGTLISSRGAGKRAMLAAATEVLGKPPRYDFLRFAGMTDRLILDNLLDGNGWFPDDRERLIDQMLASYLRHLDRELQTNGKVRTHPGVDMLLKKTANDAFVRGLVTGNIREGATLKLQPVDLNKYFPFGAFGDDSAVRNELPPLAVHRAEQLTGEKFTPENIWVIGDTPRDIECGKVNGYRTLAVATGGANYDELRQHNPDAVFHDLSDSPEVLKIFNSVS